MSEVDLEAIYQKLLATVKGEYSPTSVVWELLMYLCQILGRDPQELRVELEKINIPDTPSDDNRLVGDLSKASYDCGRAYASYQRSKTDEDYEALQELIERRNEARDKCLERMSWLHREAEAGHTSTTQMANSLEAYREVVEYYSSGDDKGARARLLLGVRDG